MPNSKPFNLPFNGKFWTADPASIGQNFQTLKNMRYTDTHIKGVRGMSKINVTALTTMFRTRSAYHFNKSQPQENHVIVQAWATATTSTTSTTSVLKENTAVIPGTAAFTATAIWTDTTAAGIGFFSDAPDGQMIYANSIDTCIWGGTETYIAAFIQTSVEMTAANDVPTSPKDLTEELQNIKNDSANIATIGGNYLTFVVGVPRPAQGAKFYIKTANTSANTVVVKHSTATVWTTIAVTGDTTIVSSASFAQTGTISWASPITTTKPKYLYGYYLYWYQFTVDAALATTSIYHITMDCPFQSLIDMWDGIYRDVLRFFLYRTAQEDSTVNVLHEDYDSSSVSTYAGIGGLVAVNEYLEAGFAEKQTGLYFVIPNAYVNLSACVASVDYWNGAAYASVGDISDGTSEGGISFAKPGVISWQNANIASEVKKQYSNASPLYYYRIKFTTDLAADVRVDYVGGIQASQTINNYKFPLFAQGRVLLCADMSEEKNKAVASAKYMPQVYNGADSVDIYFGEEGELTCGTELFSQLGSSLYSLVLMFKDNETWIMAGQDITYWQDNTFLLSSTIGCPAPLTLKTVNLAAEPGVGINRALAIWQGANGVYMSDGRAPIPIHGDIREYFDRSDGRCINASKIGDSVGFIDSEKQEYHWLFASGTAATTLDTELVYDIHRNKWFEMTDRALQCGILVHDTYGNPYCYGFTDSGYMKRLENGTDFDGTDITHQVQTGDFPLADLFTETRISDIKLVTVAKVTTTANITLSHYPDGATSSGTDITLSPIRTGYGIAQPTNVNKLNADAFHSIGLVMVTDNETIGFEPVTLALMWQPLTV